MANRAARSLYELIGAPLMALVDAESQAAKATASFIKGMGFEPGEPEKPEDFGDLKMVAFRCQKREADGKLRKFKVEVPLLSLLPIPALQIKDAELEFLAKIVDNPKVRQPEVTQAAPEDKTKGEQKKKGQSVPTEEDQAIKYSLPQMPGRDLKAIFGAEYPADPTSRQRRLDMLIKMKIKMAQADIPAGLSSLFNLMQQSISSTEE